MKSSEIRIVDVVFGEFETGRARRFASAAALTALLHGAPWLLVAAGILVMHRPDPTPDPIRPTRIEIQAPPPPKDPPREAPPPKAEPLATAPRSARPAEAAPAAPAQAGKLVGALEPDPNQPVDLSGETFVTGTAGAYAGGVTASNGTSEQPVLAALSHNGPVARAVAPVIDRSAPVSLEDSDWHCPWPSEADDSEIDQQTVVLKARVGADGRASAATLVVDPGHGFGSAAVGCALRTRFVPARDRGGRAVDAESPPIRVRFIR